MIIHKNKKLEEFAGHNTIVTDFGIAASSISIESLPDHKKPQQVRDEIPTLNQFGYMKFEWDEFCKEFVDYARGAKNPVLEIAPAYGWVTHRALEQDIEIIAADISKEHLEVLLKDAPKDKLDKLHVYHGKFPDEMGFPDGSLSAVLASRLFHFLTAEEIKKGLEKINKWLEPDGKFICSNCSIHHYTVTQEMLANYREGEAIGDKWCGRVKWQVQNPEDLFYPFDISLFETVLPEYGFEIEKIKLFDYPSDIYSKNNEGHIGFVAKKVYTMKEKN